MTWTCWMESAGCTATTDSPGVDGWDTWSMGMSTMTACPDHGQEWFWEAAKQTRHVARDDGTNVIESDLACVSCGYRYWSRDLNRSVGGSGGATEGEPCLRIVGPGGAVCMTPLAAVDDGGRT